MNLLTIRNLIIHYITEESTVRAVNGIDLSVDKGKTLGLVGETGAGKTTTALGVMQLVPDPPGKIISGEIWYDGINLLDMKSQEMQRIRGNEIAMIFQDPMTALNPVMRVVDQIAEIIALHENLSKKTSRERALEVLDLVGIQRDRGNDYPSQFSGGMKQRVVIAIALACSPKLIIADEPTTALDVTIQAQVLDSINDLKKRFGTAMLLITHDLGIVAETCDKVAIMYAGEIIESGSLEQIFDDVKHPYTIGLFGSIPNLGEDVHRLSPIKGLMPNPADLPSGCSFHPRCPDAMPACPVREPAATEVEEGHFVRCLKYEKGGR